MKNKITLLIIVMLIEVSISSFAQAPSWLWAKGMSGTGDDEGRAVAIDASGNVYTTGYFQGTVDFDPGAGIFNLTATGTYNVFISKLDSAGNFDWAKRMGGTNTVGSMSIALDASDNVYTTGYFNGTADFDPGTGVFNLTSASATSPDIFISMLDSSGNFAWAKRMGGTGDDQGFSIAIDRAGSGDIYTTGSFHGIADFDPGTGVFNLTSISGYADIFISKLDSSGNFAWAKRMGGAASNSYGQGMSIDIDSTNSGNVYTTGSFIGTLDFDPGAGVFNLTSTGVRDIFISKLDSLGNFVWAKRMGGTNNNDNRGYSVALDASGNVYTTGYLEGTVDFDPDAGVFNLTCAGGTDIFISKLNNSGNFVWAKSMGGTGGDYSQSIAIDISGNV